MNIAGYEHDVVLLADYLKVKADADRLAEALEATAEALELSLQRLGVAGEGDGKDRKADVDSWGGNNALTDARAALKAHEDLGPSV